MNDPMICGGVYEWADSHKNIFQGTLVSITKSYSGERVGTIMSTGYVPENVKEGSERWGQFKLIGKPAAPSVGRSKKKV